MHSALPNLLPAALASPATHQSPFLPISYSRAWHRRLEARHGSPQQACPAPLGSTCSAAAFSQNCGGGQREVEKPVIKGRGSSGRGRMAAPALLELSRARDKSPKPARAQQPVAHPNGQRPHQHEPGFPASSPPSVPSSEVPVLPQLFWCPTWMQTLPVPELCWCQPT